MAFVVSRALANRKVGFVEGQVGHVAITLIAATNPDCQIPTVLITPPFALTYAIRSGSTGPKNKTSQAVYLGPKFRLWIRRVCKGRQLAIAENSSLRLPKPVRAAGYVRSTYLSSSSTQ